MRYALPLVVVGLLSGSCAHAPLTLSAAAQQAFTADQVVVRVNELMNAAIAANTAHALDAATTRLIVEYCVTADRTLAAVPDGWRATVAAGWTALRPKLAGVTSPGLVAAIAVVDALLGGGR